METPLSRLEADRPPRVVVALSGGVDSSVAAALLARQGYRVSGIMMRLWAESGADGLGENGCCSESAVLGARRVCVTLGIPFQVVDFAQAFESLVVDYFCDSYARGQTPNPCLACNQHIKFGALLQLARQQGADCLATGHYARVQFEHGQYQLLRGADRSKDQSYVLYMLGQQELEHVLFPVGRLTKGQVRAFAAEAGLPTATRAESQDACFIGCGDYRAFVARRLPETLHPGPIVDECRHPIGRHRGVAFYTVGQREGLGIAAEQPLYVLGIDANRNELVVGRRTALLQRELVADHVRFVSGSPPESPLPVNVKIRYRAPEAPATLLPLPDQRVRIVFAEPQAAITPGQAAVFYREDLVLGGGIIAATQPGEVPSAA
jgi:tRNA-specific 2-thiouridylase